MRVLVVEDDPVALDAHCSYVERVPGFVVAGRARFGQEALRLLGLGDVDLVLLDMNLPDMHGLDVCRAMRAAGRGADVIAVTSARELSVVRAAVSAGIVQYLLKPFVFAALRERLERYAAYRGEVAAEGTVGGQDDVDRMLGSLRVAAANRLPKGLSRESLEAVVRLLEPDPAGPPGERPALSAGEVGERLGMSRVSARRYLEHLTGAGLVDRATRYGGAGRPEVEYRRRP
ncbi:MAG: response regulator [Actinobacteria bacterium]|nr:response regulator [Actinomycetota bacterium]